MSSSFAVELPAAIRPLLEAEARDHGFASVSDYLAVLIWDNAPVEVEDSALDNALAAGLASGDSQLADEALWTNLRARVRDLPDRSRVD